MSKKEQRTEEQQTLPGIPPITKPTMWRVNYQYQGPNYALRAGSLMIPGANIETVRLTANGTLKDQYGDRWFNITKITLVKDEEAPF